MKTGYYILLVFLAMLLLWLVPKLCNNKVCDDEIWWEIYFLEDGSVIRIIHSYDCDTPKPLIAWDRQCKMLRYHKDKIDVYDHCINEDEAVMLNAISKKNIKYALERQWIDAETEVDHEKCKRNEVMWDTSDRIYEICYSIREGELIEQNDDGILSDYYFKKLFKEK